MTKKAEQIVANMDSYIAHFRLFKKRNPDRITLSAHDFRELEKGYQHIVESRQYNGIPISVLSDDA